MKEKYKFYWVIRKKEKGTDIFGRRKIWHYWANRCSLKNKGYITPFHSKVKWFATKEAAEDFYMKKGITIGHVNGRVIRKKMFLDRKGEYEYFKNARSLEGRR